jgi:hypothetical protein
MRTLIRAQPYPVAHSILPGTTTVTRSTGDGSPGRVNLTTHDGIKVPFAFGTTGEARASWIQPDLAYEFQLHRDDVHQDRLGRVTVTMGSPWRQLVLDVLLMLDTLGLCLLAIAISARLGNRFRRSSTKSGPCWDVIQG